MFTPLLVQQWQGVTWMTQCERLPDWCDTAAWRGDKTRVCHEATLPTISTGNFLSNMSVSVWPATCNVLWGGYKVKESQTGVTLHVIEANPPRGGVSLTRQPCQLFQSATCHHGMQIIWTLWHMDLSDLDHRQTKIFLTDSFWLSDPSSKQILSHPIHLHKSPTTYLPTNPVQCAPYTSFPPVGTRP